MKGVLGFFGFFGEAISVAVASQRSGLKHEKQSIGNVFPKYLTRLCRSDYKREGKLPFSLCFLCLKKRKGVLGDFGEVISVTVAIQQVV